MAETMDETEEIILRSLMMGRRLASIMSNRATFSAIQTVLGDLPMDESLISRDNLWLDRHGHVCEINCLLDDPLL